jgi:hypothetical protein
MGALTGSKPQTNSQVGRLWTRDSSKRSSGGCLRLGLADEVRYSILPILNGDGIPLFEKLYRDVALDLAELKAYKSGTVALRYEVRGVAA